MKTLQAKLVELLEIPSVTGNEAALCDFVESHLIQQTKQLGNKSEVKRIDNSLIFYGSRDKNKPSIVLAGHLDTVPGDAYAAKVRVEGENIFGLGASDMKAGLAVMLELLNKQTVHGGKFNLLEIFYSGEEGPHKDNGLHKVLEQAPELKDSELCILLEPTVNALQLGCMGSMHAKLSFIGKRAHSARPWQGTNALALALPFLQKVLSVERQVVKVAGLEFYEVLSLTQAHTGDNASNVIPDLFCLNLNYRFAPGREVAAAKRAILEMVQGQAKVEFSDAAPSGPVIIGNTLADRLAKDFSLAIEAKQAYTDVALFALHDIAALNFGPGLPAQAHQRDEYVPLSNLQKSYEILNGFIGA